MVSGQPDFSIDPYRDMFSLLAGVLCFASAWLLTEWWRRKALTRKIIDIPNERSSHSVPTARGGGLAIVVSFTLFLLLSGGLGRVDRNLILAIAGGGILVAGVGFVDDHNPVSPRWRLLVHAMAATWAVWQLGGVPPLQVGSVVWNWSWAGDFVAVIAIVWFINLTNFMDGIDGLAGAEAAFVAIVTGLLIGGNGLTGAPFSCFLLAAAVSGFLVHNWPPARIFMGDVGSGFLGFALPVLVLASGSRLIVPGIILLAVFLSDSTITLLRRFCRRARWFEAHRSHAYQHAAQRWGHLGITVSITAINILWLAPMAYVAWWNPAYAVPIAFLAFAPLVAGALYFQAGLES